MCEPHPAERLGQIVELTFSLAQQQRQQQRIARAARAIALRRPAATRLGQIRQQPRARAPLHRPSPRNQRSAHRAALRWRDCKQLAPWHHQQPGPALRPGRPPVVELARVARRPRRSHPSLSLESIARPKRLHRFIHAHEDVAAHRDHVAGAAHDCLHLHREVRHRRRAIVEAGQRSRAALAQLGRLERNAANAHESRFLVNQRGQVIRRHMVIAQGDPGCTERRARRRHHADEQGPAVRPPVRKHHRGEHRDHQECEPRENHGSRLMPANRDSGRQRERHQGNAFNRPRGSGP